MTMCWKRSRNPKKAVDFNHEGPVKRLDIDITLRCNQKCSNCNRMIGVIPPPEDMTVSQIELFIKQFKKTKVKLDRINVVGGEPLLHPDVEKIWDLLYGLVVTGLVQTIFLWTNGTLPIPRRMQPHAQVNPVEAKSHFPVYISPRDTGWPCQKCTAPIDCGILLNAFGYFSCAAASSIARLFDYAHLALHDFPADLKLFDFDRVCPDCICAHLWPLEEGGVSSIRRKVQPFSGVIEASPTYVKKLNAFKHCRLRRFG